MKIKMWIDRLFDWFGYVSKEKRDQEVSLTRHSLNLELDEMKKIQIDKIVNAIKSANMIKTSYSSNKVSFYVDKNDVEHIIEPEVRHNSEPNWYVFRYSLDVNMLQRIFRDMMVFNNSPEYEYLKKSISYKIERDMDVLMRLGGVIR